MCKDVTHMDWESTIQREVAMVMVSCLQLAKLHEEVSNQLQPEGLCPRSREERKKSESRKRKAATRPEWKGVAKANGVEQQHAQGAQKRAQLLEIKARCILGS